jgi:hypothetical protein
MRHILDTGRVTGVVGKVAEARLSDLAWELAEAMRRRGWSQRHERREAEADAWSRGVALLDGMVHHGSPPDPLAQPDARPPKMPSP